MSKPIVFGPYERDILERARQVLGRLKGIGDRNVLRGLDNAAANLARDAQVRCMKMEDDQGLPVDIGHPQYVHARVLRDGINKFVQPLLWSLYREEPAMKDKAQLFLSALETGHCLEDDMDGLVDALKALVRLGKDVEIACQKANPRLTPWGRMVRYFEEMNDGGRL